MADVVTDNHRREPSRDRADRRTSIRGVLSAVVPRRKKSTTSLAEATGHDQPPQTYSRSLSRASTAAPIPPASNRMSLSHSRTASPTPGLLPNGSGVANGSVSPNHRHSRSRSTSGNVNLDQRNFITHIGTSLNQSRPPTPQGYPQQYPGSPPFGAMPTTTPPVKRQSGYAETGSHYPGMQQPYWRENALPQLPPLFDDLPAEPSGPAYSTNLTLGSARSSAGTTLSSSTTLNQGGGGVGTVGSPRLEPLAGTSRAEMRFSHDWGVFGNETGPPVPPKYPFGATMGHPSPVLPVPGPSAPHPPSPLRAPTPTINQNSTAASLARSKSEPWRAKVLVGPRPASATPPSAPAAEGEEGQDQDATKQDEDRRGAPRIRKSVRKLLGGLSIHKRSPSQPPPASPPPEEEPTPPTPPRRGPVRAISDADALISASSQARDGRDKERGGRSKRSPSVPAERSVRGTERPISGLDRTGSRPATGSGDPNPAPRLSHVPFSFESPKIQPLSLSLGGLIGSGGDSGPLSAQSPRSPRLRATTPGVDGREGLGGHGRMGSGRFSAFAAARKSEDKSRALQSGGTTDELGSSGPGPTYTPVSRGTSSKLFSFPGTGSARMSEDRGRVAPEQEHAGPNYAAANSGTKLGRAASRASQMT
ncbi:hypothetical protein M427DRAFT_36393, partial [Gonapodya prolifera JEL478]